MRSAQIRDKFNTGNWFARMKKKKGKGNKTERKLTHCSWLRPSDPYSLFLHRTSSCCGCTPHLHTGTRGCGNVWQACSDVHCNSPATRQTHRSSRCRHRSATGLEHTPSCCTGRTDCCRWVWDRKPHLSRLNSHCPCRKRRRQIHTGHWHTETHYPCILWQLVRQEEDKNISKWNRSGFK